MDTPMSRATEAMWDANGCPEDIHPTEFESDVRKVLVAALDRDELAQVLAAHHWGIESGDVETWHNLDADEQENLTKCYEARQSVDAIIKHLLKED